MFHDVAGHEDLTEGIIGCGIRVHEALGPGLLESVYRSCMILELEASGYTVETTRRVSVIYRGRDVGAIFCPDLIVNAIVLVELKAVERLAPVAQDTGNYVSETHWPPYWPVDEFSRRLVEERNAKNCST